jgi:DNA-binding winged helix-turn-helix (wHTH) protein
MISALIAVEARVRFCFGEFVLDDESRQLLGSGRSLPLPSKAYELLRLLLGRRPAAVGRRELLDRLWPDTAVGYTSLPRVVVVLRRLLGDQAREPRFLRTVRGFGYAFSGPVREEQPPPRAELPCALAFGGRELGLAEGETLIGRGEGSGLRVDSGVVSRRHARVVVTGHLARLEDLGSRNGTFLNGQRLREADPVPLSEGDEIRIGGILFVFRERYGPGSTLSGSTQGGEALSSRG